jgi:hypothetical protein
MRLAVNVTVPPSSTGKRRQPVGGKAYAFVALDPGLHLVEPESETGNGNRM